MKMAVNFGNGFSGYQQKNATVDTAESLFEAGLALHQRGKLEDAQKMYERSLLLAPAHADSLHLLGVVFNQLGWPEQAVSLIQKAIHAKESVAVYHSNLGGAYRALGRLSDALKCYEKAISLDEKFTDAIFNHGLICFELGRSDAAIDSYVKVISIDEKYIAAYYNCAIAYAAMGGNDKAIEYNSKVLQLNPSVPEAHVNRGNIYQILGNFELALDDYKKALNMRPDWAEAHNNMGKVLRDLSRLQEAEACFAKAVSLNPNLIDAHMNRAHNLAQGKQHEHALRCLDRALELSPDHGPALLSRASVLDDDKRHEDAIFAYEKVIDVDSQLPFLLGAYLHAKMKISAWSFPRRDFSVQVVDDSDQEKSFNPFIHLTLSDSAIAHRRTAKSYAAKKFSPMARFQSLNYRESDRIKIGFFSANFNEHPVSYLLVRVFEALDRSKFEITLFSFANNAGDQMQDRLEKAVDQFIDISTICAGDVAKIVADLCIDIAVDLMGYTQDARTEIFAGRCAPIQVNYLGYPGTMGVEDIDYIVADKKIIPSEMRDNYTEKVVCLPNSYMVYDNTRQVSDRVFTKAELGLPNTGFVFCCFNNTYKILPAVFDSWMRILNAVDGSVLWLSGAHPSAVANLRAEAEKRGVNADRLVFADRMPLLEDHLARYRMADLFLDTAPYNAHTTAADALWAGLPVLTRTGQSFACRVAGSLLQTSGLDDFVTHDVESYEAKAIELATQGGRLAQAKLQLRDTRTTNPLFDTERFTRDMEKAFTAMYDRYHAGLPPDHFDVS